MIPKTIHYCWFGGNPLPKLAKKCIKSWKKYCPDYEIIRWDESNYDIASAPLYVRQAYEAKKWAFVTDYVRLHVVYEHGGIYMDTDVELVKNLDHLLNTHAYFGFENGKYIATGLGFGAEKNAYILHELMDDYTYISFLQEDGTYDLTACPVRNTSIFAKHGVLLDDTKQYVNNMLFLPSVYMSPMRYWSGNIQRTDETLSIHWYSASWQPEKERRMHQSQLRQSLWSHQIDYLVHTPNRIMKIILGENCYNKLKELIKK